jgi:NADH dehydrogenase
VLLIDRNNYHLFQPLLYQVASAYLDPEQIAKPIRGIFHTQKNFSFRMAEVTGIRLAEKVLETNTGRIAYDYLILAAGGADKLFRHGRHEAPWLFFEGPG